MNDNKEQKKSFQEKLSDKYRIVILDEDTLGEVKSTRISFLGLVLWILGTVLLISLITAALLCFTPLKYLIPGYADINNNKEYVLVNKKLEEIEQELDAQRVYTNGLKNLLNPSGINLDGSAESDENIRKNSKNLKNSLSTSNRMSIEDFYFCCPLKGEISAGFDINKKHFGIDIVAEKGSPIKSMLDGVVINADWSFKTGNTISIQHDNDLISIYKHNSELLKKVGESVNSGEAIAIIGNTGELTAGPHVHIELWKNGRAINPERYINFN